MTRITPDIEVSPGEHPEAYCSRCDRPFDSVHARDLHLGEVHVDDLDDEERAAFDEALATERDDLWLYHAKVVAALGAIYAATVVLYMVTIQSGFL